MSKIGDIVVKLSVDASKLDDVTALVVQKMGALPSGTYDARIEEVVILDELWPAAGANLLTNGANFPTVARSAEVSMEMRFADFPFHIGSQASTPETVGSTDATCDHPEDDRIPLPYQGRPANPAEWECGSCGAWNLVDRTPGSVMSGSAVRMPPAPPPLTYAEQAMEEEIQKELRKKQAEMMEAQVFTNATPAEVLQRIGMKSKFDAKGSLEITMEGDEIPPVVVSDGSKESYETLVLNHFPQPRRLTVFGPVDPSEMGPTEVVDLIFAMEYLPRTYKLRQGVEWACDAHTMRYVDNALASYQQTPLLINSLQGQRLLFGNTLTVSANARARGITMVAW